MERDSNATRTYTQRIYPRLFGTAGDDSDRNGPITACVVIGPPGSGKRQVALRAQSMLEARSLQTMVMLHSDLLAEHPDRDSETSSRIDADVEQWQAAAIDEAARRKLGLVTTLSARSEAEATKLLDCLQQHGYAVIAFAVCTPASQLKLTSDIPPAMRKRVHDSDMEMPWITESVEAHPAVSRQLLVDRHGNSYASDTKPTYQLVACIRSELEAARKKPTLIPRRADRLLGTAGKNRPKQP